MEGFSSLRTIYSNKMPSLEKIREGIFKISWEPLHFGFSSCKDAIVFFPEIAKSCKLTLSSLKNPFASHLRIAELEIELSFPSEIEPKKLNAITILVSKNGKSQTVIFENSKWNVEFVTMKRCQHRCCDHDELILEIVIDLTYGSPLLMKKESKRVLDQLLNLWNSKTLADISFKFEDKIIQAHTSIVTSGSSVLAAMFKHNFKEKEEKTVVITDIQSKVFDHLLRYIYTGDADLNNVHVAELLTAADKYGMDSLKEECALHLSKQLSIENATQHLLLAHLHNSPVLHKSTLNFMSKNAKAICFRKDWMELLGNYPELCSAAIQSMVMGK